MGKITKYNFQKIWSISSKNLENRIKNYDYRFCQIIPMEWQLILINDGSFTQNLISLTGKNILLHIAFGSTYKTLDYNKYIRGVWLQDNNSNSSYLTFARSSWPTYISNQNNLPKYLYKPIGQSLVESRTDIYKDIHEIYYGYCINIEDKLKIKGPIWGRKYTIYYKNKPLATIEEIFSSKIKDFFI